MESLSPKKSLPRIRTFAKDLEMARQRTGQAIPATEIQVTPPPTPTPILGSALSTLEAPAEPVLEAAPIAAAPAFHELKKAAPTKPVSAASSKSPTETTPNPIVSVRVRKRDTHAASPKMPVSTNKEAKSAKVGILRPLRSALAEWFSGLFTRSEEESITTTLSQEVAPREEPPQSVLTKSGPAAVSFRATKKTEAPPPSTEKEPPAQRHEMDVTWTPNIEPGYALLEDGNERPAIANVVIDFKKTAVPIFTEAPVTPPAPIAWTEVEEVEPIAPKTESVPVFTPLPSSPELFEQSLPPEPIKEVPLLKNEPLLPSEKDSSYTPSAAAAQPIERNAPVVAKETSQDELLNEPLLTTPEAHFKVRALGNITALNTNTLSLGVVGIIAGLVLCIIVLRALFGIIMTDSEVVTPAPATPIIEQASVSDLALSSLTRTAVLSASSPTGIQNILELRLTNEQGVALPVATVLDLLGFTNSRTFNGTVEEIHLATYSNERAIVISVDDPTAAFGSLLAWEDLMPEDLGPLLTIPQSSANRDRFEDLTIGSSDVRIYSVDGKQVLVYGFIDRNTVVFANNVATFSTILAAGE